MLPKFLGAAAGKWEIVGTGNIRSGVLRPAPYYRSYHWAVPCLVCNQRGHEHSLVVLTGLN